MGLLLSCEHASSSVPARYRHAFASAEARELLKTHRGYDRGARPLARLLEGELGAPLIEASFSRLLIDFNRSPNHPRLFSDYSRQLAVPLQDELRAAHRDYQAQVRKRARALSHGSTLLHLALHSFTPVLNGKTRTTDIGLLFDPARAHEAHLAAALQHELRKSTGLCVHRNAPYRGIADGLPTLLRREFTDEQYMGFEFELNQRLLGKNQSRLFRQIVDSLARTLARTDLGRHSSAESQHPRRI